MKPDSEDSQEVEIPSQIQKRTLWSAITAFSVALIGAIVIGAIYLGGQVLSYLQPLLVPLAIAGIIAYLLDPFVKWLQKRGWTHRSAMLLVFFSFLGIIALLITWVAFPTFGEARDAYERRGEYQERVTRLIKEGLAQVEARYQTGIFNEYYNKGIEWISQEAPKMAGVLGEWVWSKLRGAFGLFGYALGLFLVPIYLFFFLQEGQKLSQVWTDYIPLRASKLKDEVVGTLTEINGYLISYFRGQMVVSLIDGALVAIALTLMGMPYALLIGVFLALLGMLPYIGNALVMIPALLIAIAHYGVTAVAVPSVEGTIVPGDVVKATLVDTSTTGQFAVTKVLEGGQIEVLQYAWSWLPHVWAYPIIVLVLFLSLQQLNSLVTAPRIVGDSVGLHPLTVIFSVLFWSFLLGGILGAILAVPLTASIKVLFRRYLWENRLESAVESRRKRQEKEDDVPKSSDDSDPPADNELGETLNPVT